MAIALNTRIGFTLLLICCCYMPAGGQRTATKTRHIAICANPPQSTALVSSFRHGSYQWNTGDTSASISISKGGTYSCRARFRRKQLEEVFEVEEKQIPAPDVPAHEVICKPEEIASLNRPGLLWFTSSGNDFSSGRPAPPKVDRSISEFSLYVARQEGGCFSEKKEIKFEFLFYMLCPDFINGRRYRYR